MDARTNTSSVRLVPSCMPLDVSATEMGQREGHINVASFKLLENRRARGEEKGWRTSPAGVFLAKVPLCLCSWRFFAHFFQVFKFYLNMIYEWLAADPASSSGGSPVAVQIPLTSIRNLPRHFGSLQLVGRTGS